MTLKRVLRWMRRARRTERACWAIGRPVHVIPERRVVKWYAWAKN